MKNSTFLSKWIFFAFLINLIFSISLRAQYNGTHYVGTGEEFETIQEAVDSLVSQGVDGATTILVKAKTGNYHEQVIFTAISGASAVNTVTFQSETKNPDDVMIYYDATTNDGSNGVVRFISTSYITFEYFKVVNSTLSSSYTSVIYFNGTCENIRIRNNLLVGESGSPSQDDESVFFMWDDILTNTEITNNTIQGGSWAVYFQAYGDGSTKVCQGTKFNYNTCSNRYGIKIEVHYGIEIIGNEITSSAGNGIELLNCEQNIVVVNNKISSYSTSAHQGMYFDNCDGSFSFEGLIANNVVFVTGDDVDSNYGIQVAYSDYQEVYHNTVYLKNAGAGGFAFYVNGGLNVVVKNNLFAANYGYAYGCSGASNISKSDYNNYYNTGNYLAKWNGGNVKELSNLKTANSQDANSQDVYHNFISTTDITGLIPTTHWLDNKGTNLTDTVDYDIDSVARPTSPDIGAYEFSATNSTTYSGTYSIGTTSGTFASFNEAIDSLKKLGVSGPVIIDVESDQYTEQIAVPAIPGVSATNTLTFQSAEGDSTQVIMQHEASTSSDNYVVFLNGADYITFKDMTFKTTGATYARIFRLNGRARDITITNNVLDGNGNPAGSTIMTPISSYNDNVDNLTINNNLFKDGDGGIHLEGDETGDQANGIVISNNQFTTSYDISIYVDYSTNFEISNNDIQEFKESGIRIYECTSPYEIKNNKLSSTAVTERGIYAQNCDGTGDGGLFYNNFIHVQNSADIRGIWLVDCYYQSLYNNSINVISSNSGSKGIQYDGYSGAGSNMVFKNNNIVIQGPGYPLYIENADATVSESDYNNLYTTGTYIARWNPLTYDASGYDYSDIASLTAASGQDAHSVVFNPSYFSESDLHTNSYWLDGAGVQLLGLVTDDIDGEARSNPPDIGADEYTSTALPYDGEYTIGASGRFATFSIAVDSLIERGILDTVIFKVQSQFYPEQFVIPQIAGASSNAAIIFESESGNATDVTLTFNPGSSNNYIVKLDGADYITFRNMSFQSGADGYDRIFSFGSKCENISLTNNIFGGSTSSNTGSNEAILYADGAILNNLFVDNNIFNGGSYGTWLVNSSSTTGDNLMITNNTFDCIYLGIYVKYFKAPVIENNDVTFISPSGVGISVQECPSATSSGLSVQNNTIYADAYADDAGALYFVNCDGVPAFPGLIANNVINVGINDSYRSMGIDVRESDYLNLYYNTVNIKSNNNQDIALVLYNSSYNNIINNNLVIKGNVEDQTSSLGYAIYIHGTSVVGNCNYNNYYSAGRYLAHWGTTDYGSLDELKAVTGKDANSINYFPGFRGDNNLTMKSVWLDGKGTPLTSVTEDNEGVTRHATTPDIGAYEFTSTLSPIATGTYTVGSLGGDYPSLDSLFKALMECGIDGPVTFNIMSGSYPNTNLTIKDIPGTSVTDTIVIQSLSGDPSNTILSHTQESTANYIIRFVGTDYLTIQNLKFNSGGTTYSNIFRLAGNSQFINIVGNELNGVSTTGDQSINQALIYIPTDNIVDNLTIKGNTFNDNSYGISFRGFTAYNHTNINVIDNVFVNQYRQIYFYRTEKPYIEGNEFTGAQESAIYLQECDNDLKILNNKVFTTDPSIYAIYLYSCDGTTANKGLVANNFVGITDVSNSYAIYSYNSNYQRIYYNSLRITGTSGAALYINSGGNIEVANNILSNFGTTTYAYNINSSGIVTASDYNDIYSEGTNYIYFNGSAYTSLGDYQTASAFDGHSIDYNPVFTSSTDFHLLADSVVGKAVPLAVITTDFDGEPRNATTPDIGADEFSCLFFPPPVVEDVTACSNDSIPSLYADGSNIEWYSDKNLTNNVWSANEYDPAITTAGVYTYYATQSAVGCTSVADSAVLTIYQAPILTADITHIDCQGTNYGAINLSVSGSTASPYSYLWSNDEIYQDIDNLEAGDYTVTVEDLNGCTEIDTFTVTAPDPVTLSIITEDTECDTSFGSATVQALTGEAPFNFRWNTGDTTTVIDDLYAGIYNVTATDNRGCEEVGVATVSDIGAPDISNISVTDVSCYGGSTGAISLTVSGGTPTYTYEWSNGATTKDITNVAAGPYQLVVDDADGCQAIKSFNVEEPDPIKIALNITETSCGQSNGAVEANVTGGTSPYTYAWYDDGSNTGVTDSEISGLDLGVYNIDVSDDNGCDARKYFSISELGAPSVIVDSTFEGTCGNSDGAVYISVYGEYASYTYLWDDASSSTTEDLVGVNPGTYSVTVSDAGGCDAVQVATIDADKPAVNPICMVTVDSATNHNEIIWEKQYTDGVDYYKVYKETTQSGVYTAVGTVDVANEGVFVDEYSDVMQRSWRYKLAVVDVCGVESDLSEAHKTMHLTINLGINNSINLIWNDYEGFDYDTYYIYRKSNSGWALIDSVPSNLNSYTDANPIMDESLYYMIEIKHPGGGCDPASKATRNSSRSNISDPVKASGDNTPPTAPSSLTATEITDTTITLRWVSSTDDVGVAGYGVYKNDALLEEVTDTTYKATGLTESTTYKFYIIAKDDAGNYSDTSNVINPTTTSSTGIPILNNAITSFKLYPNPTEGRFILDIETSKKLELWYEIYSVNGVKINKGYIGFIEGNFVKEIDIENQGDGIYFIKIYGNSDVLIKRLIISK